jgi:hypothetical protein
MKLSHSGTPTTVAFATVATGDAAAVLELVPALFVDPPFLFVGPPHARIKRPTTRQHVRRRVLDIFVLPDPK